MTRFKKCPLCKLSSFFCDRCHSCFFEGCNKYYTNQFEYDVLFKDDYYNEFISCKIHSKHLRRNNDDA